LGGFIGCIESMIIVGWSIGIQLTWWTVNQTWRLVYKKETNNNWTYDPTYDLMVNLEIIIASTSLAYIVDTNAYKSHLGDIKKGYQRLY